MQRLFNFLVISLLPVLFLAGCADSDEPMPGDTVLGSPTRPNSGEWINPEDTVYGGAGADYAGDGLDARDGGFNALGAGNGMGGANPERKVPHRSV